MLENYLDKIQINEKVPEIPRGLYRSVMAVGLMVGAYNAHNDFFSKIARACNKKYKLFSKAKYICVDKAKLLAYQQQIKILQTGISKCSKDKNPKKCTMLIKNKILKLKRKVNSKQLVILQMQKSKVDFQPGRKK